MDGEKKLADGAKQMKDDVKDSMSRFRHPDDR